MALALGGDDATATAPVNRQDLDAQMEGLLGSCLDTSHAQYSAHLLLVPKEDGNLGKHR